MDEEANEARVSVANEPSSASLRKLTRTLAVCIVIAFGVTAAFGTQPLARSDGFVPAAQAVIFAFDLLTAVILFGQFAVGRARAMLALATGYLCSGLFVLAHTLTFPGAFAAAGLFGATSNTAGWLYIAWHACFPTGVILYVLYKQDRQAAQATVSSPAGIAILNRVIFACALVVTVTALLVVADERLPTFLVSERSFNPITRVVYVFDLLLAVVALAALEARRESVLDEWLRVAVWAAAAEATIVVLAASRYTVGFYSVRLFAIVVSGAVLIAVLWELTSLYAKHAVALHELQRERANKLMNVGLMVGSIAHEIRQPLAVLALRSGIVRRLIKERRIDVDEVQVCLDQIEQAGDRVIETVDSVRALFRNAVEGRERIDVNELVRAALRVVEPVLDDRGISLELKMAGELPPILGHKRQLQEVLLNILQNAVDAMKTITDRARTVRLQTAPATDGGVAITIEDSGIGIEPQRLAGIFEALTTTKPHGTGLGLGICRMIVDQHGGELSVKSELGKGTEFRVVLLAEPAVSAATALTREPARDRERKRLAAAGRS